MTKHCPICSKEPDASFRPFCSHRCKMLDLGKWLNGSYAIPTQESEEDSERVEEEAED